MANSLYGYKYNPTSYGKALGAGAGAGAAGAGAGGAATNFSSLYGSRSLTDPYSPAEPSLHVSSRYLHSDVLTSSASAYPSSSIDRAPLSLLLSPSDSLSAARAPSLTSSTTRRFPSQSSWAGVSVGASDSVLAGLKRPSSEMLCHQNIMGAYNKVGQSEAWLSSDPVAKHPRFESTSNLPIYPQRPGEKDCTHYMLTRTCRFGENCKFDHPIWVPEGGIPDWKEVPVMSESLPERPGEPDCPYFLKTQKCKFGANCKFNHPKDKIAPPVDTQNASIFPERPSEPECAFYMKTGLCKFGANCKFHHPKEIQVASDAQDNDNAGQTGTINNEIKPVQQLPAPALMHNSKGLPIRLGEIDCPFYLKTGSCKYGATCRYSHPDRSAINKPAAVGPVIEASPTNQFNLGFVNPDTSILQNIDQRLMQTLLGVTQTVYPQRPGQIECDYYMKTGICSFGERCKYHHPIDRSAPQLSAKVAQQQNVKLTLAGLPRREGSVHCPYYMKTGICKYAAACKFDHPPPGEVMAMGPSQGTDGGKGTDEGNNVEEKPQLAKQA